MFCMSPNPPKLHNQDYWLNWYTMGNSYISDMTISTTRRMHDIILQALYILDYNTNFKIIFRYTSLAMYVLMSYIGIITNYF